MVTKVIRQGRVVYEYVFKSGKWVLLRVLCSIMLLCGVVSPLFAGSNTNNQVKWELIPTDKIVDAIYLAEGGSNTNYPFGIKSVKCSGYWECRKICTNSVNNNKTRYGKYLGTHKPTMGTKTHKPIDFITFMGNRYCPPTAHKLNNNWVKNVKYFLAQKQ